VRKFGKLALGTVFAASLAMGLPRFMVAQSEPGGNAPEINSPEVTSGKSDSEKSSARRTEKLDLNSATNEQLRGVSGISDAVAKKIIAGCPYRTKLDLVHKKIISRATYDKIKEQIIAKRPKPNGMTPAPK
jgi:competence protein ComEA